MRKIVTKKPSGKFENLVKVSQEKRSSIIMEGTVGEHFFIKTEKLLPYKKQARRIFDDEDLKTLAETIKEVGVRQPLTVIKSDTQGYFEVISGERRLRAAVMAGLEKVPCIILSNSDNIEEIALIENLQRVDLHPVELGEAYKSLMDQRSFNIRDLARKVGVSKSVVGEQLNYAKFPQDIKDHLINNKLKSRNLLRQLTKALNPSEMRKVLGIGSEGVSTGRRKNLLNLYLQDGKIGSSSSFKNISDSQKNLIIKSLEKVIGSLK